MDVDADAGLQMNLVMDTIPWRKVHLCTAASDIAPFLLSETATSVRLITFHGHFHHDTQDASLRCGTESLFDPKLSETLRLDTFDI